jgi:hypothetical protein
MSIRSRKLGIAIAGASLALVGAVVALGATSPSAAAWAASSVPAAERLQQATPSPSPSPKPGRPGEGMRGADMQQREQMRQAYLNALAGHLGVTVPQLEEAMKQARIDLINQAVAAGRLDQNRANQIIQAIQSGTGGPGGPGLRGPAGQGPRGPMFGGPPRLAADVLGLTPQQLWTELQSGKSLAQVAETHGMARDTFKSKLLDAQKARLDAAVAAGRLTPDQAKQIADRMAANIDRLIDMTPGERRGPRAPGAGA